MKRLISMLLCIIMLCSLSVAAFAAETPQTLTMKMDRNGRTVYYEDGTKAPGYIKEDVEKEFHHLRHGHPVNWDLFAYEEMTFELDENGDVKALSQYIVTNDGKKYVSSDPGVFFIDSPKKIHGSGAGEASFTMLDADGNELASSTVKVSGVSFSSFLVKNECGKCGEDQGNNFHFMSCSHFSCEVGRAGHGDADCGTAGHYKCDGKDHSICFNCLQPVCNGKEHGRGVCPHVHSPVHVAWDRVPTCSVSGIERIMCSVCGYGAIVEVGPCHLYNAFGQCVWCGQYKPIA